MACLFLTLTFSKLEGDDWQRHRRLTAPSFNEKTSSVVWGEAIRQSQDMGQSWFDQGTNGTLETVLDTATSALHVLTCVGFGLSYPFHGGLRDLPAGHTMTYRDALSLCLRNIIIFAILPKKFLTRPFMPNRFRALGTAAIEFQKYMEEMLSHERIMSEKSDSMPANLMSSLVRASDQAGEARKDGQRVQGLKDNEIFGNIFMFNLAGHETTANTIAAALVLLAANPRYQRWLAEEVHAVFAANPDSKSWKYEEAFPKLQRCLGVMVLAFLSFVSPHADSFQVRDSPLVRVHSFHPQINRKLHPNTHSKGQRPCSPTRHSRDCQRSSPPH